MVEFMLQKYETPGRGKHLLEKMPSATNKPLTATEILFGDLCFPRIVLAGNIGIHRGDHEQGKYE